VRGVRGLYKPRALLGEAIGLHQLIDPFVVDRVAATMRFLGHHAVAVVGARGEPQERTHLPQQQTAAIQVEKTIPYTPSPLHPGQGVSRKSIPRACRAVKRSMAAWLPCRLSGSLRQGTPSPEKKFPPKMPASAGPHSVTLSSVGTVRRSSRPLGLQPLPAA